MTDREMLELAANRNIALSIGESRYFTGEACKHGHISERLTRSGACAECRRISSNEIYKRDREKISERHSIYRQKNREIINLKYKIFYFRNKDRLKEQDRQYRILNPEKNALRHIIYRNLNIDSCKEREKRYRQANPEKIRVKHAARRALKSGAEGSYTNSDIKMLHKLQREKCANCTKKLSNFHVDHITPLSKGGSNWIYNINYFALHAI